MNEPTPRTTTFVTALANAGADDFAQFLEKVELFGKAIETDLTAATSALRESQAETARWKSLAVQYSAEREHNSNMADKWKAVAEKQNNALTTCQSHCYSDGMLHHQTFNREVVTEALTAYQKAMEGGV